MADTYYLIDYENVNCDGLVGCDNLTNSEHIIIFFTKNAMKINMSEIADHGSAKLEMIEIPAGKQSVDIHISSYIGYLSGINDGKSCSIVIVSKDLDFDNVIKFWGNRTDVKISRANQIRISDKKTSSNKNTAAFSITTVKKEGNTKTELNNFIMQTLRKAGFDNEIAIFVASIIIKNNNTKNSKQQIYRTIITKYGQSKDLNIYNHIKKNI